MEDLKYNIYPISKQEEASLGRFTIHLDTVKVGEKEFPYSYLKVKNSISVLPIVNGEILLVKQYRHALKSWEYEIPGGGLEDGEIVEEAAARELIEETGYKVDKIEMLGMYYPSSGLMNEKAYLCVAYCHDEGNLRREPLELMTLELVSESTFESMIISGVFKHGMGIASWLKYKLLEIKKHNLL